MTRFSPWILATVCCALSSAASTRAAPPETFVKLDGDSLHVTVGRPVRLSLHTPEGEDWTQANIAQLQLRTFGQVESLLSSDPVAPVRTTFTIGDPGSAMLIIAVGPGAAKNRADSVSRTPYCAKLLLRVLPDPSDNDSAKQEWNSAGMTAKVGMRVEVSPFINPFALSRKEIEDGADLPVRVYFEGSAQKQAEVIAHRPDGTLQRRTTDGVGTARFRLDQVGRWLIRYQHEHDGVTNTGDLVFDAGIDSQGGD